MASPKSNQANTPATSSNPQREEQARQFALSVVQRLREAGYEAYWAGGCVRDMLLGLTPHDYDVATNARPEEVQRLFRRTVAVGASFGVVEVLGPKVNGETLKVQVATFRQEGPYSNGRHPDSVVFTSAAEDAQRRDFTINGLFYDPLRHEVLDYVGGQKDLQAKLLRAIGDPRQRFAEDKLRMLRAVRLAAQFGLTVEPATASAIRELAQHITVVSAERIAEELRRLLVHPQRTRGLELLRELNLLQPIFPELAEMPRWVLPQPGTASPNASYVSQESAASLQPIAAPAGLTLWQHTLQVLDFLHEPTFPLALAALFHDAGKMHVAQSPRDIGSTHQTPDPSGQPPAFPGHEKVSGELLEQAGRRLRLSNAEWQRAVWLVVHHHALDRPWDLPLHRLKPLLAHPGISELLHLIEADARANGRSLEAVQFCREKLQQWPREVLDPPPLVTGDDLIAMGLKPGPIFRHILGEVRNAQLDGTIAHREQALQLARKLAQEYRE